MSKFFKVEEFACCFDHKELAQRNCDYVNDKLEQHGKIVYNTYNPDSGWYEEGSNYSTKKALLINIEAIEKCKHPKDKVNALVVEGWDKTKSTSFCNISDYQCECGAKVKPKEFEEVK